LQVPSVQEVYAIGDFAGFLESTGSTVLPALAQVKDPGSTGKTLEKPGFLTKSLPRVLSFKYLVQVPLLI